MSPQGRSTMIPWRNVAVLGFVGACLFAGCTVTTSDGTFDGGLNNETGGSSNTGGATNAGGSSGTGGAAGVGGATGPVQCTANYQPPTTRAAACGDTGNSSCNACLQTNNCTVAYKACFGDNSCTGLINAMTLCMLNATNANGGTLPNDADANCQTSSGVAGSGAGVAAAEVLWTEIQNNLDCVIPCCAV